MKKITALVTVSIVAALLAVGASAQSGNNPFSPGETHTKHVNVTCEECHTPWRGVTDRKCLSCHEDVDTPETLNGSVHQDFQGNCRDCHSEHEGRVGNLTESLNHDSITGGCSKCHLQEVRSNFSTGDHWTEDCQDCHSKDTWTVDRFDHEVQQVETRDCIDCHDRDLNESFLPGEHWDTDCAECHATDTWSVDDIDHDLQVVQNERCTACHADTLEETLITNFLPGEHWTDNCDDCHGTDDWSIEEFDHSTEQVQSMECTDCHDQTLQNEFEVGQHWETECDECHDTQDWSVEQFDHARTQELQGDNCVDCHTDDLQEEFLPGEHYQSDCGACHGTDDWDAAEIDHTQYFRLTGDHDADCSTCHTDFQDFTQYTCYGNCHGEGHSEFSVRGEHREEGISDFTDCAECHTSGEDDEGFEGFDD